MATRGRRVPQDKDDIRGTLEVFQGLLTQETKNKN